MSNQHKPDPEFVEYLKNEVKNPYLSAPSVMQMERVFIDQRNKYEAKLEVARVAEEAWEKTMMEVIGEDGPASVADAIRKLQDQAARAQQGEGREDVKERLREAISEALGEALDCTRVWEAWGYGTMSQNDFQPVNDDPDRLEELVNAALSVLTSPGNGWMNDVVSERQRQDQKWGGPEHDDQKSPNDFVQHIEDYAGWARVMAGMGSFEKYRRRMVQVAALAGAAIEASDRALKRAELPTGESK